MSCQSHPWQADTGLTCQRDDAHLSGHVFVASWFPDVHTDEVHDD